MAALFGASAVPNKADIRRADCDVRFYNRPSGVKHFQTVHHCNVDVTHRARASLRNRRQAVASWGRMRWNNLYRGLAVRRTSGPSGHANSPHPSSREGHHSTAPWSSSFLLSRLILHSSHATAVFLLHRNSVPSVHMRCMITANRRSSATIAFFIPRRLAICIAQALSHDHSALFCRSNPLRPIDTWRMSAQTPPRRTWTCGSELECRRWHDRSATPRARHQGLSSSAGTPRHPGRWPASGDAG